MSNASVGRIFVAVVVGYLTNGILVLATEAILASISPARGAAPLLRYFVVDLINQCFCAMVAGYVCCLIARPSQRMALTGLIGIGLSVGTFSLVTSWKSEPHWYGIGLFIVYSPCVWFGWSLRNRLKREA
jgi:hypothetical protein